MVKNLTREDEAIVSGNYKDKAFYYFNLPIGLSKVFLTTKKFRAILPNEITNGNIFPYIYIAELDNRTDTLDSLIHILKEDLGIDLSKSQEDTIKKLEFEPWEPTSGFKDRLRGLSKVLAKQSFPPHLQSIEPLTIILTNIYYITYWLLFGFYNKDFDEKALTVINLASEFVISSNHSLIDMLKETIKKERLSSIENRDFIFKGAKLSPNNETIYGLLTLFTPESTEETKSFRFKEGVSLKLTREDSSKIGSTLREIADIFFFVERILMEHLNKACETNNIDLNSLTLNLAPYKEEVVEVRSNNDSLSIVDTYYGLVVKLLKIKGFDKEDLFY